MKLWASVVCYRRVSDPELAGSSIIHQDSQDYSRNLQMCWDSYYIIILIVEWGWENTSSVPPSPQEPQVRTEAYAGTSARSIIMVADHLPGTYKWLLCVTESAVSPARTNWLLLFREMTTGVFWELYGTHKSWAVWSSGSDVGLVCGRCRLWISVGTPAILAGSLWLLRYV